MTIPAARILAFSDLSPGCKASVAFTVTAEEMAQFAALSGDYNPLHCDPAFAQSKGFKGAVVYGALIVAKISQLIGMQLPGRDSVWSSLHLRFHHPLYVGAAAQVDATVTAASIATGLVELALLVTANDVMLAKGKAEILVTG